MYVYKYRSTRGGRTGMKAERAKFTTSLKQDLLKQLKIEAIKTGRNVNDILEELVQEYLEKAS